MKKNVVLLAAAVALFCFSPLVHAAEQAGPEETADVIKTPVQLDGKTLFYVLEKRGSLKHKDRAALIAKRLQAVANDTAIPAESLTSGDFDMPITIITAQEQFIVGLSDFDAELAGSTRRDFAAEVNRKLQSAIRDYRREHSLRWLFTGAALALVATALLVTILFFLGRLCGNICTRLTQSIEGKRLDLRIQSVQLLDSGQLTGLLLGIVSTIRFALCAVILLIYVRFTLGFFPWTRSHADTIGSSLMGLLGTIGSAVWAQMPNLTMLAAIILLTVYTLKLIQLIFKGIERGRIRFKTFRPEWAQPTYRLCRLGIVAFSLVVAFPYIPGSESPAFKGVSIFLGVLFSLGSTSAIANLISGYTIIYRNLFVVGDRIKIGDISGTVVRTGLQVIHLRTVKNEEITVPSSVIVNSNVVNYSALAKRQGLVLHTGVTIGYDTPWRQVHGLLLQAAGRTDGLKQEPEPFVLQKSLDDFYVAYELNAYTDSPQLMERIYSDLHKNIQDAFNEYGVQIMSPHYVADPARAKVVPKERWNEEPSVQQEVDEK